MNAMGYKIGIPEEYVIIANIDVISYAYMKYSGIYGDV
jgi:hypothetical protein